MLVLLGLLAVTLWQRFSTVESAVDWQTDLQAALKTASATGKPVLISFSSAGCIYCKKMEAEVIPQKAVLDEIAKFIPVKIDGWADPTTSRRYGVDALPAYVVTDATGRSILMLDGYQPADVFVRFLRNARLKVEAAKQ